MLNQNINVDLHIHSKASEYKEARIHNKDAKEITIVENSTLENIDILLNVLNEKNINLFAFTDHNRFDCSLYLETKHKLETKKWKNILNILPGVEFDVKIEEDKKTCHIITIFDCENDEELKRISDEIKKVQLEKPNDYYDLKRFDRLMKEIHLNTIFIACQRKSLDNPNGGASCISDSTSDIYEFLKVGFISALEYQKANVEGMLLDNLKDFPREIGMVCGSDCHQWECYPKHDKKENLPNKKFFFTIKSLPTFSGLLFALTSPHTRFNRNDEQDFYQFDVGDSKIELSSGINAIIGENGSGKTTLLNSLIKEKVPDYSKKIIASSNINISKKIENCCYIEQNEIITKNTKGFIFDEDCFSKINNSIFEQRTTQYTEALFQFITNNISKNLKRNELKNCIFEYKESFYKAQTYYISVTKNKEFGAEVNQYKNRISELNNILEKLLCEINQTSYETNDKDTLMQAYNLICKVRRKIINRYKNQYFTQHIKNIISQKINEYETKIRSLSVKDDRDIMKYKNNLNSCKNNIISFIKDYILKINLLPEYNITDIGGYSNSLKGGYRFIKKTNYYNASDLKEKLLQRLFKKEYQSIEKIKQIKTEEELADAISGANLQNYKLKYSELVNKFINDQNKEAKEVLESTSGDKMGSTLGEKSLVYYKYLTYEDDKYAVLCIDQPEDNISNKKIEGDLTKYLNNLRDKKPIIFITHNPLLVVNLDVDNVLAVEINNSVMKINSGCLENSDIIRRVSDVLDGGKEVIEKRVKLYYGN